MSRKPVSAVLGVLCIVLFGAGLVRLLLWRFETGDVYPAYSSLRADPLGCMALHETLGTLPGVRSERFLDALAELPDGQGACLLLLGSTPDLAGSREEVAQLDRFLAAGGRIVVALEARRRHSPRDSAPAEASGEDDRLPDEQVDPAGTEGRAGPKRGPEPPPSHRPSVRQRLAPVRLGRHWDYAVRPGAVPSATEQPAEAALQEDQAALPASLPWHGDAGLALEHPQWRSVYAAEAQPVVACRRVGKGLLVLAADSYLFSNEGLRQCVQPEFLSWAIGPADRVLFDETHFGIEHRRGVMALARRYGLHGFFAALAVLALLVIWQGAVRLAPAPAAGTSLATVSGRAAQSALEDLLRRHTPPERLLGHCVQAWARTARLPKTTAARTLESLQECLRTHAASSGRQRRLAACYRDLCQIVARRD